MDHSASPAGIPAGFDAKSITRPNRALMTYYLLVSLITGPGFFIAILPLFFKYETLRYHFDDEGVSMSWGFFFRKEVYLTYRRIQDIHLTRNILQRWLGLATVSIQTASGSASPEVSIEGILEADALRDFLYTKMRGAKGGDEAAPSPDGQPGGPETQPDEVTSLLREIRDALRQAASGRQAPS